MWAKELLDIGNTADSQIHGVAELIDSYVEKLLSPAADGNAVYLNDLRLDLAMIAVRELGDHFTPGWLTRTQVLDVLLERGADAAAKRIDPAERMVMLLNSRLLEEDELNPELMRIALDPIAEHLVARDRVEHFGDNVKRWQSFLDRLEERGWPADFVDALLQCICARGYGLADPALDTIQKLLIERAHKTLKQ
jgi:hypothetical protein